MSQPCYGSDGNSPAGIVSSRAGCICDPDWSLRPEQEPRGARRAEHAGVQQSQPTPSQKHGDWSTCEEQRSLQPSLLQPGLLWSLPRGAQNPTRQAGHSLPQQWQQLLLCCLVAPRRDQEGLLWPRSSQHCRQSPSGQGFSTKATDLVGLCEESRSLSFKELAAG